MIIIYVYAHMLVRTLRAYNRAKIIKKSKIKRGWGADVREIKEFREVREGAERARPLRNLGNLGNLRMAQTSSP